MALTPGPHPDEPDVCHDSSRCKSEQCSLTTRCPDGDRPREARGGTLHGRCLSPSPRRGGSPPQRRGEVTQLFALVVICLGGIAIEAPEEEIIAVDDEANVPVERIGGVIIRLCRERALNA